MRLSLVQYFFTFIFSILLSMNFNKIVFEFPLYVCFICICIYNIYINLFQVSYILLCYVLNCAASVLCKLVKTENEKRRFVMKVQAFCEEKGLRSFLGVFGYAESKNQCWQAEKWLLPHLICIFPRWPPKLRKTSIAAN